MKKWLLPLGAAAAIVSLSACNNATSDVIVETNAGDITKDEFYQELKSKHGEAVLDQLVTNKLLNEQFDVTDDEIQAELDKIKENFPSDDQFSQVLEQNGYSDEAALKEDIRMNLLSQKAATANVEVTDEKLQQYYEENEDAFTEVEASHILVADEATANDVLDKLNNGGDFAELAKEYSEDPGSAAKDGSVGTITKDSQMVPEFINGALALSEGDISEPVKSQFGYHIIKVTKRTEKTLEDNREDVEDRYLQANAKPIEEVLTQLKQDANITVNDDQFKDLFKTEETSSNNTEEESTNEEAASEE